MKPYPRWLISFVVVVGMQVTLLGAPAYAATELSTYAIYEVAGVPGGDRAYVATGTDQVLVTDAAGRPVGSIDGLPRSTSLALGTDGTLWVGLPDARQIAAVDTGTLAIRARYSLPDGACPGDVAVTGRFVVFGFNCFFNALNDDSTAAGVGVLDTTTGTVRTLEPYLPGVRPIVATSPNLPNKFFAVDYNSHSTALALLDVSTGTPQWVTSHYLSTESVFDMAVSPDGSTVAIATYFDNVQTFHTADVSPATVYQMGCLGVAVGWSADSRQLAASCLNSTNEYNVARFTRDNPVAERTAELAGDPERRPVPRGLVVGDGAQQVLIGTRATWESRGFVEQVGLRPSAVTMTPATQPVVTRPFSLRVGLTLDGVPAPAGIPVQAYRDSGTLTSLGTALTDASGTATFTDTPSVAMTYQYLARFAGNEQYAHSGTRISVTVDRLPTSLSIAFEPGKKRHKSLLGTVVVSLGPTLGQRSVTVTATTSAGVQTLGTMSVPLDGSLRLAYTVTGPTTLTATYDGSPWELPATASTTVTVPTR